MEEPIFENGERVVFESENQITPTRWHYGQDAGIIEDVGTCQVNDNETGEQFERRFYAVRSERTGNIRGVFWCCNEFGFYRLFSSYNLEFYH